MIVRLLDKAKIAAEEYVQWHIAEIEETKLKYSPFGIVLR